MALKLFGDGKFQQALLPCGKEINYFFELSQDESLLFLCCHPPEFTDDAPIIKNNNNPSLCYESKKDVLTARSLLEWAKAVKLETFNPALVYLEMMFSFLGEGRVMLKPFITNDKNI